MEKPYLIMLPGWGMGNSIWYKFGELLSEKFHLVFIEWNNINSINEFKAKVINIITESQIHTFSLLGWSLGSLVALDIAATSTFRINALILIGSTSSFIKHKEDGYSIGWDKRIVERMKVQLLKNTRETLDNFNYKMFSEEEKKYELDKKFLELMRNTEENTAVSSLALSLDYLIQKDCRIALHNIKIPVLLIHGTEDSICPLNGCTYISDRLSTSNIELLENTGHIPFFTKPYDCFSFIVKFIFS